MPINTQSGASYNFVTSDGRELVQRTAGSAQTDTPPTAGSAGFTSGFSTSIQTTTHGDTLTPASGTVNGLSSLILGPQQFSIWTSDSTNNWNVFLGVPQPPTQTGTTFLFDNFHWGTLACANLSDAGNGCSVSGANPTATAGATAVNGSATTYMRSDGAPALPMGTSGHTIPWQDGTNAWSGAQRGVPVNVAISTATFTPNFDTGQNFEVDLTSACPCTLANPSTTLVAGQSGVIEIHQDGTGSRTITTWGSAYRYLGGTSTITLSTAASAKDYLSYYVNNAATGIVLGAIVANPSH